MLEGAGGKSVGNSLKLVVEKDVKGVDVPYPGRTLYDNEGKYWEIEGVRCFILITHSIDDD